MKKNLIAIGVMCAALLAFGLGLYFLREEPAPAPELEGPTPVSYLFQHTRPPLSVRLEMPGQEPYTMMRLDYDPARNLVTNSTIPELAGLPVDTSRVSAVISASRSLTFLELVGDDIADLAPFGLAEPRGVITLDFEELGIRTILIGDVAPGNIGVYIQLESDVAVYLTPVHGLDNFLLSPYDYLDMNVTPLVGWPPDFDSITLAGQVRQDTGEILIATTNDGERRLLLPFEQEISPLSAPIYSAFGIVAMGVALTYPTQEDLEMLGLYPAWSTLTVESREHGNFTVHASQPDEGGMVFLYREGVTVVYTAFSHGMYWLEVQFYDIMMPFAISPDWDNLVSVQLTLDGREHLLDISGIFSEASTLPVVLTPLLSAIVSIPIEHFLELPASPYENIEPVMVASFFYADGSSDEISLFSSEIPLRHYIRINNNAIFLAPSSSLEEVREQLTNINAITF